MKLLVRATRAKVVPVFVMPSIAGSVAAWGYGVFDWPAFLLTLFASAALHLGVNVATDAFDELTGLEDTARRDHQSISTGSGVVGSGALSKRQAWWLSGGLLLSSLALWLLAGWRASTWAVPMLGGVATGVALLRSGKPLRYGYFGRGLEEAGVAGVGILIGAASFAAHVGDLTDVGWLAPVIPSLHLAMVTFHHGLLRWRSDREGVKRTPVSVLGPEAALPAGRILAILTAIVTVVLSLAYTVWPPGAAVAALSVAPVFVAGAKAGEEPGNEAYVGVLGATLGATVFSTAVLAIATIIRVASR